MATLPPKPMPESPAEAASDAASELAESPAAPAALGPGKSKAEKTMIEAAQDQDSGELDCYECRSCSYVYEPLQGDSRKAGPGTAFESLPVNWRCPVCSAPKPQFFNVGPKGTPSGFKENLGYGFGVNALTPGQKNVLIFGSLLAFFFIFLSFYGLG